MNGLLATGSYDGTAIIWNENSSEVYRRLEHHDLVNGIRWSPDGIHVAVACADGNCHVWNVSTGARVHVFSRHTDDVNTMTWSPDGTRIATVSEDGTGRIWSITTGTMLDAVLVHADHCMSVDWHPILDVIATCGEDASVRTWTGDGEAIAVWPQPGDLEMVRWNPDGTLLGATCDDGTVRLIDAAGELVRALGPHSGAVKSIAWSPDGRYIAAGAYDCGVDLWSIETGKHQARFTHAMLWPRALDWSADGARLAVGGQDAAPTLVEVGHAGVATELSAVKRPRHATYGVNSVCPRGGLIFVALDDGTIREWDGIAASTTALYRMPGNANLINALDCHEQTGAIGFGSFNATVGVLASPTAEPSHAKVDAPINAVTWHPDGRVLAVADYDGTVSLFAFDGQGLSLVRAFRPNDGAIKSLAWLDAEFLVTGSTDRSLCIVDQHGKVARRLEGHGNLVNCVAVSRAGNTPFIASASRDRTARIWNPSTGVCEQVLIGHTKSVKSVAWSRSSAEVVATGSYDFDVRVWDISKPEKDPAFVNVIQYHSQGVGCLAWSPDKLITASWDGSVATWDATRIELTGATVLGPD